MAAAATDGAMDTLIRPVAAGDLPTLLALYHHLNHDDPDMEARHAEDRFAEILAHPGMTVFASLRRRPCRFLGHLGRHPQSDASRRFLRADRKRRHPCRSPQAWPCAGADQNGHRDGLGEELLQGDAAHRLQGAGDAALLRQLRLFTGQDRISDHDVPSQADIPRTAQPILPARS